MNTLYDGKPEDYEPLIQNGYDFRLGDYISRGWEIFNKGAGNFVGFALITLVGLGSISMIPFIGTAANLILSPFFAAGFYLVARKYSKGEQVEFGDFFGASNDLVQLILGSIISAVMIGIGFICLVLPGIYLAVALHFTVPFIVLARLEFWPAIDTSRKVITKQWLNFFLLALVGGLILIGGVIAFGIGIFVAYPVVMCISYAAFEDVVLSQKGGNMNNMIDEIGIPHRLEQ